MAENITLNNVATFQNDTSAVNTINNNNTAIVNAFADVLSRSGGPPNQMTSTLDMNNNQIINLPPPTTASSPARLIDVVTPGSITVNTATTGTSGHVVPFLDGTNTWSAPQTITLGSLGTSAALNITATSTGTISNPILIPIVMTDGLNAGAGFSTGLTFNQVVSGTSANIFGGREAINGVVTFNTTSAVTNTNRNYVGVTGQTIINTNDNGSGVTSGTAAGAFFGGNFAVNANSSATNLLNVSGMEVNATMVSGSSAWAKSIAQFSGGSSDAVSGSGINTMLWLYNQSSAAGAKWTNGILFDNDGGTGFWPIAAGGTIIKSQGSGTVTNGIDFNATTFTGFSFVSPAFSVSGSNGSINTGLAGTSSGSINFSGGTSGTLNVACNSTATLLTVNQPIQVGVIGTTAGQINIAGITSGSAQLSCSATGGTLQMGAGNLTVDTGGNLITNGAIRLGAATALVAGGDTGHPYLYGTVGTFGIFFGSGAPTISASQGSLYIRSDGSTNITRAYINTTGSTVWTAINTVA